LEQWNKPVYEYVTEFLRLSQFAQYMVEDEKNGLVGSNRG